MNTVVGKVSNFVYTVATPFHPFGGAVDIISVQQQDGSFRSTPWYVRFGKFQGVLKGAEKVVRIEVNGVEANFQMYLDNSGEAYFVREVISEKEEANGVLQHVNSFNSTREDNGSIEIDNDAGGDDAVLSRHESCDSNTGQFQLRDEHVALGVDRLDRTESDVERSFYDFQDVESSFEDGSAELSEYGSSRYDNFDLEHVVEAQNLSSEVVLVSVDGHVLTAPILSMERKSEDMELNTPQFHLGQDEGTNSSEGNTGPNGGESAIPADYSSDQDKSGYKACSPDLSNMINENNDFQRQLEICAGDGKDSNQEEVGLDAIQEKELQVDGSLESTSAVEKVDVPRSHSELQQLAMLHKSSRQCDMGSPVEIFEVAENLEEKYCESSLAGDDTEDAKFGPITNGTLSNSNSPRSSSLAELQEQTETLEKNALDQVACGSENRTEDTVGANKEVDKSAAVFSPQLLNSEVEFSTNETTLIQQIPASEETSSSTDDVERQTNLLNKDVESTPRTRLEISLCKNLLRPGMGSSAAAEAFDAHCITEEEFKLSSASIVKNENLVARIHGNYLPWDRAAPIIIGMAVYDMELIVEPSDVIPVEQEDATETRIDESGISSTPTGRGWRLWPIPFRRGRTIENTTTNSSTEDIVTDSEPGSQKQPTEATSPTSEKSPHKQLMRTNVPTSDQIASLDLKEGQNLVTFISNSRVLGPQKVEAHIYLWKWNARIVISDVDGTITKSDVLGQFMPLVGKDWTHSGIARLFSAIKENGYQLLFLSARAIVQAYLTKSFLFNLKQDGNTLPNGPVVISPDGLFPSLYREVIRRAPHEFKIACLEDIKSLFPPDYNPFYAGFGNRDTDELSYRKIGIPKGKIFIINPKGEVAINHRIDVKSYTSLHTLVHDMFPPTSLVEQEDYNSWNYWKMPVPDIDDL